RRTSRAWAAGRTRCCSRRWGTSPRTSPARAAAAPPPGRGRRASPRTATRRSPPGSPCASPTRPVQVQYCRTRLRTRRPDPGMGANHAHGHGHGTAVPASRRAVVATLAVLLPLAAATLAALVLLWPEGRPAAAPGQAGFERVGGTGTAVVLEPCGKATIAVDHGGDVTLPLPSGPGSQRFAAGDDVVLLHNPDAEEGMPAYQLSDHDRSAPLLLLGAAFALAVIAFGRWRGLTALA